MKISRRQPDSIKARRLPPLDTAPPELVSPTGTTTPTAHNVLEQYISPTSAASMEDSGRMDCLEHELGEALHCLQSERDKQYSEI